MNTYNNPYHGSPSAQRVAGSALGKVPPDPLLVARAEKFNRERLSVENQRRGTAIKSIKEDLDTAMNRLKVGQLWKLDDPIMPNGRCRVIEMPLVLVVEGPYQTLNDVFVRAVPLDLISGSIGWKEGTGNEEFRLTEGVCRSYTVCLWEERPVSNSSFERVLGELSKEVLEKIMQMRRKLVCGQTNCLSISDLRSFFRHHLRKKFEHASSMADWRRCALEEFVRIGGDIKKYVPYLRLCDGSGGWVTDDDIEEILDIMGL